MCIRDRWEVLWAGEDAFWKNAANIRAAGLNSILALQQVSIPDSTLQVPRVTREQGSRGHQHFRIVIPRGIQGISEQDRATLQAWLGLVDWSGKGDVDKRGRRLRARLAINPVGPLKKWLDAQENPPDLDRPGRLPHQQGLCEARLGCRDGSPRRGPRDPKEPCMYVYY